MEQKIIDFIVKEVNPYYNDNLQEVTRIFLDTLEYEIDEEDLQGVGTRIKTALNDLVDESQPLHSLLPAINKVEPYARKVLYLTNREEYRSIKAVEGGFSPVLKALGVKIGRIQSAYDLRNMEAHSCKDWTRRQYCEKISDVLVAYIIITARQLNEIKKVINGNEMQIFNQYVKGVISQYKSQIKNMVQLESEEDISLLDLNVVEVTSNEKVARRGTIRSLMSSVEEKRMILWGAAGAGKTSTLEYITYLDAKDYNAGKSNEVPVLVYLGMTTDEHLTLEDYIAGKLGITRDDLAPLLKHGNLKLYFDGFNEIPYTEQNMLKTKRRRELSNLITCYPRTFIILTNRPQDGKEFWGIPVFNLLEMDTGQVNEFIQKNAISDDIKKLVDEAIKQDENLFQLVKKPLILKSLLFIAMTTGNITKREGLIIGDFLKALFAREQQEKYDEYLDVEKMNLLLRRIGYETFESNRTNSGVSKELLFDIMNRCQKDYSFSYDNLYALNLIVHLGIMNKRDNQYVFAHQSYQDYYAAQEELAILNV